MRRSLVLASVFAVVGVFLMGCSGNAVPTATSVSPITGAPSPSGPPTPTAWDGVRGVMVGSHEGFLNAPAVGLSKDEREPGVRGISPEEARAIAGRSAG